MGIDPKTGKYKPLVPFNPPSDEELERLAEWTPEDIADAEQWMKKTQPTTWEKIFGRSASNNRKQPPDE